MSENQKPHSGMYYFTGTGNSLCIARVLEEALPNSQLHPIVNCLKEAQTVVPYRTVGLVFPLHHLGTPGIIRRFVAQADLSQATYLFAVVTGGNPRWSAAFYQLQEDLQIKGLQLHAGFYLPMPATYFAKFRHPGGINPQKASTESEPIVASLAQQILRKQRTALPGCKALRIVNRIKIRNLHKTARHFHLDEGCIRCGYCQMVCPAQNIQLRNKRPHWSDRCLSCFACIHNCSQGVIQYKNQSQGKARYRHPGITLGDLAAQRW